MFCLGFLPVGCCCLKPSQHPLFRPLRFDLIESFTPVQCALRFARKDFQPSSSLYIPTP
jgi:hypothetical protein